MATRELTLKAAILEALHLEFARDLNVVLLGEDVGAAGGIFKQTAGLFEQFGAARVIDTPISETGIVGLAVGAAMNGARPIVEVMFGDFLTLVMDPLVNQAAKTRWMSAGQYSVPLVLRTAVGVGGLMGPQHSQSLYAWLCHVPGLKVVIPSTPADAKGLFAAAVRDDDPVVFFEDRNTYNLKGPVPEGEHIVPIGRAAILRSGRDVTLIAFGRMVSVALSAAAELAAAGIEAEVIDVRSLVPLDLDTLVESVKRTGRAVVIDAAVEQYGVSAELAAAISEHAFDWLDGPVLRVGAPFTLIPTARTLEPLVVPSVDQITSKVQGLFGSATL